MKTFLQKQNTEELIYLFSLGFTIFIAAWQTTLFPYPLYDLDIIWFLPVMLIIFKTFYYHKKEIKYILIFSICIAVGELIYMKTSYDPVAIFDGHGYHEPLVFLTIIAGSKNVDFKKILKLYIVIVFSVLLVAFIASITGIIPNLKYKDSYNANSYRYSFGILHPTDFGAHIFYLMLTCAYLIKDKIKIYHYILGLIIAALVMYFSRAKTDVFCMLLLIAGFFIIGLLKKYSNNNLISTLFRKLCYWSMPVIAYAIILLTLLYSRFEAPWTKIPSTFSSRFIVTQNVLIDQGITLLGQYVGMLGLGGSTEGVILINYTFLDISYFNIAIRFGILFLITVIIIAVACCEKMYQDSHYLFCMALISISCASSHHLIDLSYCIFLCVLFTTNALSKDKSKA